MPKTITITIGPKQPNRGNRRDVTVSPTYARVSKGNDETISWSVDSPDAPAVVTIGHVVVVDHPGSHEPVTTQPVPVAGQPSGKYHMPLTIKMKDEQDTMIDDPGCPTIYIE